MLVPKGRALYENLSTSFTYIDAMLAEFKTTLFTGYVLVTGWAYEGILLLDTGQLVHAVEESHGQRRRGPGAAEGILARAREKEGTISVYRLSEEIIPLLACLGRGEPIYKDLTSDFTRLDKLMTKLHNEKHTGYVEMQVPEHHSCGMVFFQGGQAVESLFSSNGNGYSGSQALNQILRAAASPSALFTVYRTNLDQAYAGAAFVDLHTREETLALWQDLFQSVERTVDGLTKRGTFLATLRRKCIELAKTHSFLDPFASEFEYKDGQIRIRDRWPEELHSLLGECLKRTVHSLLNEIAIKDLSARLRAAAQPVKAKHAAVIEKYDLAGKLDF